MGTLVYTAHNHEDKEGHEGAKEKKKNVLISSCFTMLDEDGPAHKSGFYGLHSAYGVPYPLGFSLWSPLPAQ